MDGGAGDDILVGGSGADVFVFAGEFGHDRVGGFSDGTDTLEFALGDGVDFNDLSIEARGSTTVISYEQNSVTLFGVDRDTVGEDDFIFA